MSEDEITKLKLMICHLDLSVATKEKLYNQAHKIRNQLQQKENIIKEVKEYIKENMGCYSERLQYNEYIERYVKDLNKIMKLLGEDNKE